MIPSQSSDWQELDRLIDGACDQSLSADELATLGRWLIEVPEACDRYVACMDVHGRLGWQAMPGKPFSISELAHYTQVDYLSEDNRHELSTFIAGNPPLLSFLGNTIHGAVGWFSSGWPVAYMIATVICGVSMLIGSVVHVSSPVQVARQSVPLPPPVSSLPSPLSPLPSTVARVTGMVDCRWVENPKSEIQSEIINPDSLVALGEKFALASGLMEITYDTGAKVILQGPVTYEVESAVGGYLSLGKLTARLDIKGEGGRREAEGSNPQSPIPNPSSLSTIHSPLFTITTPTATVTDLGTEFGVEVSKEGRTGIHVLQGVVEARPAGVRGVSPPTQRVTQGCAVEIVPKADQFKVIAFAPRSFMRTLQPPTDAPSEAAYINAVLADKPMGYWPLNEPAGARRFVDRSGNGVHGYAMGKVSPGSPGPFPGNSHALSLDDSSYVDFGLRDQFAMKNDFTVEAWVWIGKVAATSYVISALGHDGDHYIGWGLVAGRASLTPSRPQQNPIVLYFNVQQVGCFYCPLTKNESVENRWVHVAATFDQTNTVRLYLNGILRGSVNQGGRSALVGRVWLDIGCAEFADTDFWRGRLAHVAVYPRVLDAQQIKNHFAHGSGPAEEGRQ